ncbi:unnamed protein product [Auanema sp. JU1783]|nr:unnamed protein product [Auanema sp. JU1783]
MEEASTISSRSNSSDLQSEIDEMNNLLKVERRLVLQSQKNYKSLKHKYIKVMEENSKIKTELNNIQSYANENQRLHGVIKELEKKSRDIVRNLSEDCNERKRQNMEFRANSLAEIQTVFRKEIDDQKNETKRIAQEKDDLIEENDKLLEAIRDLNSQLMKARRDLKQKEHEMSIELSTQLDKIVGQFNESRETELEKLSDSEIIEQQRARIFKLEIALKDEESSKLKKLDELHCQIRETENKLSEERKKSIKADAKADRAFNETIGLRMVLEQKQTELDAIRSKLNSAMNSQMFMELQISEKERLLEMDQQDQSMMFQKRLMELEYLINERNCIIDELKQKLGEAEIEKNKGYNQLQGENHEEKWKLQAEKERLIHNNKLSRVTDERNRLEETVAELKEKLKTTPETIAESTRLRKDLIEKELEIKTLRQYYRDLLKKMKNSLLLLEKRYKSAQRKLENSVCF